MRLSSTATLGLLAMTLVILIRAVPMDPALSEAQKAARLFRSLPNDANNPAPVSQPASRFRLDLDLNTIPSQEFNDQATSSAAGRAGAHRGAYIDSPTSTMKLVDPYRSAQGYIRPDQAHPAGAQGSQLQRWQQTSRSARPALEGYPAQSEQQPRGSTASGRGHGRSGSGSARQKTVATALSPPNRPTASQSVVQEADTLNAFAVDNVGSLPLIPGGSGFRYATELHRRLVSDFFQTRLQAQVKFPVSIDWPPNQMPRAQQFFSYAVRKSFEKASDVDLSDLIRPFPLGEYTVTAFTEDSGNKKGLQPSRFNKKGPLVANVVAVGVPPRSDARIYIGKVEFEREKARKRRLAQAGPRFKSSRPA